MFPFPVFESCDSFRLEVLLPVSGLALPHERGGPVRLDVERLRAKLRTNNAVMPRVSPISSFVVIVSLTGDEQLYRPPW